MVTNVLKEKCRVEILEEIIVENGFLKGLI